MLRHIALCLLCRPEHGLAHPLGERQRTRQQSRNMDCRVYPMKALQKNQEIEKMAPGSLPDYHAYLLRLWREGAQKPWRAELVSPHTGAKQHFATHGQLLAYLETLALSLIHI